MEKKNYLNLREKNTNVIENELSLIKRYLWHICCLNVITTRPILTKFGV